jgi:hypothetical protein
MMINIVVTILAFFLPVKLPLADAKNKNSFLIFKD